MIFKTEAAAIDLGRYYLIFALSGGITGRI